MLEIFTILLKAHVHSLFNFKSVLYHFVNTLNPLFNFMLQQELLQILLKSSQLPQILKVFQEISFCQHCQFEQICWWHLARYFCLSAVTEYTTLRSRMSHCDYKAKQWKCLIQLKKPFSQSSLTSTKTKIFVRKHQEFWNDYFVVFSLD